MGLARIEIFYSEPNLDKLVRHLRCNIDTLEIIFACLLMLSLRGKSVATRQVFVSFLFTLILSASFRRERTAVKYYVRLDVVVSQQSNALHGVVNIPIGEFNPSHEFKTDY